MNAVEKLEAAIERYGHLVEMSPFSLDSEQELIAALYRSVDAQLGLLRDAAARMRADTTRTPEIHYRHQLYLADAILEVES